MSDDLMQSVADAMLQSLGIETLRALVCQVVTEAAAGAPQAQSLIAQIKSEPLSISLEDGVKIVGGKAVELVRRGTLWMPPVPDLEAAVLSRA